MPCTRVCPWFQEHGLRLHFIGAIAVCFAVWGPELGVLFCCAVSAWFAFWGSGKF